MGLWELIVDQLSIPLKENRVNCDDFMLGYEIEFCSNIARSGIHERLNHLGISFYDNQYGVNWTVHDDLSLKTELKLFRHEISSGLMKYYDGIALLKKIFQDMIDHGDETNTSCGFHVNLSFADVEATKKIDPLKVVLFLDEIKILDKFDRLSNKYCRPYRYVMSELNTSGYCSRQYGRRLSDMNENQIKEIIHYGEGYRKYRTCNFIKLGLPIPYLEFRAIGGYNYHKKFNEIEEIILHFKEVMKKSVDNSKSNNYYRKLEEFQSC